MGFLDDLFGGGAEKRAAEQNRALYADYLNKGLGYLDTAYGASKDNLNSALGAYQPLSDLAGQYRQGTDLYLNALGVNGAEGTQAARDAFTSSPGYQFSLDQGLDAINRRRATGGMLNSGNADIDALKFGQGLASQDYGNWLSNLAGVNQNALSATSGAAAGQAAGYGALSDLAQLDATNRIGLYGNYTSGNASANNMEAAGKAAGAKNLLGGALSLAQLGLTAGGVGGFGAGMSAPSTFKVGNQSFPMFR